MAAVSESKPTFQLAEERPLGEVRKGFTHFREGDVLFAKITPCMENGKGAVATGLRNGLGCGTTELHVIRPLAKINPNYIYRFLSQPLIRHAAKDNFTGTAGQSRVPTSFIEQLELPLPPLAEQQRIVAKLELLLGQVDACRRRLDKIPTLLKRFRQSVLAAACSGRLTEDWRGDDSYEDDLPAGWASKTLDSIFSVRTGGTPSRKNLTYYQKGTIPWIKTSEVHNCDIVQTEEFITEKASQESNAKIFPAGTLLIAMYGEGKTRGQIGRLTFPAATNQACAALINTDLPQTTNRYVFYYLLSQYYDLRAQSAGGNQPNLNLGIVKGWYVSIPPLPEQQEIVRRVERLFALADNIEQRYKKAQAFIGKLTPSLLAKAFRGELVPQDPNDEAASVLLGRIKGEREEKPKGKRKSSQK